MEEDIDEDIKRCKNLIGFVGCELREIEAQSIENVLSELETLRNENKEYKNKIKKVKKFCKEKSVFHTFGDESLKRTLEMYVNRTKNDILYLL